MSSSGDSSLEDSFSDDEPRQRSHVTHSGSLGLSVSPESDDYEEAEAKSPSSSSSDDELSLSAKDENLLDLPQVLHFEAKPKSFSTSCSAAYLVGLA
mmetsp:Transcript_13824/g.30086  ORF Transcript_13824/g.30086 Transcript_13824/m.30086 type:complete len:97 (+) Transcript_13824:148-438(+)